MNIPIYISSWVLVFLLMVPCASGQVSSSVSVPGRNVSISVEAGTGAMSGHTTYQIGGDVSYASGDRGELHFPVSELKFPLDVYMASLGVSAVFKEKWQLSINAQKNITDDAGTVEDSDWGYWHSGAELPHAPGTTCDPDICSEDSLDIYSESDAELDALILDLDFRYRFFNKAFSKSRLSVFAGLGYRYEKFSYDVSDVDQWYPSYEYYFGVDLGHDRARGKVLTYDITYYIPYLMAGTSLTVWDRFGVEGSLAFSPSLLIRDEDNHVLRDKVSEGELYGSAIILSLEGRYIFSPHWSARLALDYLSLYAKGEQDQYFSGSYFATIDEEIRSEQLTAIIGAGYSF